MSPFQAAVAFTHFYELHQHSQPAVFASDPALFERNMHELWLQTSLTERWFWLTHGGPYK